MYDLHADAGVLRYMHTNHVHVYSSCMHRTLSLLPTAFHPFWTFDSEQSYLLKCVFFCSAAELPMFIDYSTSLCAFMFV